MSAARLRHFLERIERLEEERKTLADDIADVYKELSGEGFDKDAAKVVLKIRRNADALAQWQGKTETVDLYLSALGMIPETIKHRAPARTREIIEEFPQHNPDTGEVIEDQPETATGSGATNEVRDEGYAASAAGNLAGFVSAPAASVSDAIARKDHQSVSPSSPDGSASTESAAGKVSDPAQPSPPKQAEPIKAGEGVPPSSPANLSDEEVVPAFLRKEYVRKTARDYRPHCRHPEECASSELDHCYQCRKALAATEMETA